MKYDACKTHTIPFRAHAPPKLRSNVRQLIGMEHIGSGAGPLMVPGGNEVILLADQWLTNVGQDVKKIMANICALFQYAIATSKGGKEES